MTGASAFLAECEARRGRTWGSSQWSIVHVPTGKIIAGLPRVIQMADGPLMPGRGPRFFRLKRDAAQALAELRQAAEVTR